MKSLTVVFGNSHRRSPGARAAVSFALFLFGCVSHAEGQAGTIITAAGNGAGITQFGVFPGDGGPAGSAAVGALYSLTLDTSGNLFISGDGIRKVTPDGLITTVADYATQGIAVDSSGNLYLASSMQNQILKLSPSGVLTAIAGTGTAGYSGDGGPATSAQLTSPEDVAVDSAGNVYIADSHNFRVRKVSPLGVITTVAGNGVDGFSGDGGLATTASLGIPAGIALDASGNLFIADVQQSIVRKVSPGGIITTVAGYGPYHGYGFSGDGGQATSATLYEPTSVVVDKSGVLYICDGGNSRIRSVSTSGIITTVAGIGIPGFHGDGGPGTAAELYSPLHLALDAFGNLFIADSLNYRVRELLGPTRNTMQTIAFSALSSVSLGVAPLKLSATASSGLATSFVTTTPSVCTVAGSTLTIVAAGTCSVIATQAGNSTYLAATPIVQTFAVTSSAGAPSITTGGIGPLFSSSTTIQAGSWVSIYGTNLAGKTAIWDGSFPTSLGGVTVTFNGRNGYLSYVSPTQVNVQAPDDSTTGPVKVILTNAGGSTTSTVTLGPVSPAFCLLDGKHVAGIIIRSDGSGAYGGGAYDLLGPTGNSLGYATVAAKAGDVIGLFGVGFGPTSPSVLAGQAFSGAAATTNPVQVKVGATAVTPLFAGLSSAGLYQINLTIPAGLGTGDMALYGLVGGTQTQSGVLISLQ